SNSNSYHLKGYFPGDTPGNPVDETANCFKVDNVAVVESNLPVKDVKWIETENDIDFNFFSYDCSTGSECDEMIVDMGNSVFDTICIIPGGSGGGVPSVQTITPKRMYDSLCILMRLRNFPQAKVKCYQLLNTFPDSTQGLNAISKLYYLAVSLDTSTVNITDCKTYLNTLILNHPNNLSLVRKCNYYVQKCKVRLKQYQSAMTGFQQIMQQNPYSYEALLASWDYAATHLLDSLNGPGGSSSEKQSSDNLQFTIYDLHYTIDEFSSEDILSLDYDVLFEKIDNLLFNDDDKDKFTKEQRKTISSSVVTALDDSKKKSKNHIETLTKQSEAGKTDATVELKVIKTLKEVVKIKRPKTIFEHIKSVNKDIQKLNTVKNETVKKVTNVIPETYNLSQNYPNPFNPVTKINYELPKDGRVKLVIYDILGREIKSLVNELKQAGRYTVEFNGNNYASGVYFYRIQVEGGKTYTAVKKMLMIK
ncbi:MAG: T9SS type A sorting domain-containing protein, partial [Ignavibacteriae bacterium]|nr:T9SS type A sorting domain-containing protein [Ignavibacteriota bacterium]